MTKKHRSPALNDRSTTAARIARLTEELALLDHRGTAPNALEERCIAYRDAAFDCLGMKSDDSPEAQAADASLREMEKELTTRREQLAAELAKLVDADLATFEKWLRATYQRRLFS